jgi:DNA-binding PadR family transcriptional regulator
LAQLLSNIEVLLLSIVNEKPSYAYEIDKIIDLRNMRVWARIGVASIYQVLKRLEEKNLVYSKKEKEGRMPERKRYYITDEGKAVLIKASKRLLSSFEGYYLDLNVGLEASDLLTPGEMASCIKKRFAKVQSNIEKVRKMYADEKEAVFKKKAVIKNLIALREAEEMILKEFIRELSTVDEQQ